MELIDRYIHEVGRHLPRKERADIQTELRSLLLDSLESGGGEEANEEQVIALLKDFGPPQKVAASYRPTNQYLIGPELYPMFRLVMPIVLAVIVGVNLFTLALAGLIDTTIVPLEMLGNLFSGLISAFGMTVLTFAILQRITGWARIVEDEDWDPSDLPEIEDSDQFKRSELIVGIVFATLILGLLWFFPEKIGVMIMPGAGLIPNPVIIQYIPLISVLLLLGIGLNVFVLRQGRWQMLTRLIKVGLDIFSVFVLYALVIGHKNWLGEHADGGFFDAIGSISAGGLTNTESAQVIGMQFFQFGLTIALIVVAISAAIDLFGLVKQMIAPEKPYLVLQAPEDGK